MRNHTFIKKTSTSLSRPPICLVMFGKGMYVRAKISGWPRNSQMPDRRAAQNLLMPHSRDSQDRKMLHSYPGGMGSPGID